MDIGSGILYSIKVIAICVKSECLVDHVRHIGEISRRNADTVVMTAPRREQERMTLLQGSHRRIENIVNNGDL